MLHSESVLILDFGSQYTQLIARRVRELNVYCEIHPFNISIEKIMSFSPKGIILSGGPSSVYASDAPIPDKRIYDLGIPILGICYGLQLIAYQNGGAVNKAARREFGRAQLLIDNHDDIFKGLSSSTEVWMSHGDEATALPNGFEKIAHSDNAAICGVRNPSKKQYGIQFHPEVVHTKEGKKVLSNFLFTICGCKADWNAESFIESSIAEIRKKVGDKKVLCALSGGVDSSVAAVLLHKAIGDQLFCIHIDNGVMRRGESAQVVKTFRDEYHIALDFVDGTEIFIDRLKGVSDPEQKRKIIGKAFIDIFEEEAKKVSGAEFLAQGTLYPDVIESVSFKGPSQTIKTHHNVGGLPEKMNLKLIEPFRELFKDEVRAVGRKLGLSDTLIDRHPFPGPGLAIRVLGDVTQERLEVLRSADDIFISELRSQNLYTTTWQAFAVLLPVQSVGVMGDERTYENTIALRSVTSVDGMTADWTHLPYEFLAHVSSRISNEVRGVNRVVYDISSKPPATIEWE
ncbi:MAG: glutamine-hydrolyzing GMP synthase [Ignavibacteriales bacterium]|nr:glutamine-hydrolyzing GMP synthase [Ignavibacteriales bacterium]